MSQAAVRDLMDQYRRAFAMLYEELQGFDASRWNQGSDFFLKPVNVAMHIADCLDYYFCGRPGEGYRWGHRFGGGWWELAEEARPDVASVTAYLREIEARVTAELGALQDRDLARPFEIDDSGATLLGHHIYALRHTMHHHGELAALAVQAGLQGGSWA